MAALYQRKGSDFWYADFWYKGRRNRKSTGTSDRKLAELFLKEIEVKIAHNNLDFTEIIRKEVFLSGFFDEYLKHSKAEKAENTYLLDKRILNQFKDFTGDILLSSVSRKQGEDFKLLMLQKVKPITVNIYLKHSKSAFGRAVEWGYIKENPLKAIKLCRVKHSNLPQFFDRDEIKILLDTIQDADFKRFVLFCLYTGCRRNEAVNLFWDDIDMEHSKIIFRFTKSGQSRVIPFNGILKEVLSSIPRKGERPFPYQSSFVTHKFKDYVRASGIKNQSLKLHSLRHSFASHLIMEGVDVMTVSKLLGHSSISVTEMYAHLVPDHLKASVERLKF